MNDLDDDLRWDLIEAYFLGEDDYVAGVLNLETSDQGVFKPHYSTTTKKAKKASKDAQDAFIKDEGVYLQEESFGTIWSYAANDCNSDWEKTVFEGLSKATAKGSFEKPYYGAVLTIPSSMEDFTPLLAWHEKKVALFLDEDADEYEKALESGWRCFLLNPGFDVNAFIDSIRLQ